MTTVGFIDTLAVHAPGPHMLQQCPPSSYWLRGSHWGWATLRVCRGNEYVTSYIQAVWSQSNCFSFSLHPGGGIGVGWGLPTKSPRQPGLGLSLPPPQDQDPVASLENESESKIHTVAVNVCTLEYCTNTEYSITQSDK